MALRLSLSVLCTGAALSFLAACSSDDTSDDNGGGAPGDGGTTASGGATSSGGSSSGGSSSGGTTGSGGSTAADVCAPYATFEDGAKGFWIRKNAGSADGTLTPTVADLSGTECAIDTTDGANETASSVHYSGTGFTNTAQGAPGGVNIANDLSSDDCADASVYDGVSIWAKGTTAADTSDWAVAANTIVVIVGDGTNEMSYRAGITTDWGNVKLAFSDTDGWFNEENVNLATVAYLKVMIAGATFDVHVDEMGWYKDRPLGSSEELAANCCVRLRAPLRQARPRASPVAIWGRRGHRQRLRRGRRARSTDPASLHLLASRRATVRLDSGEQP